MRNDIDALTEILSGVIQEPINDGFEFTNLKVTELSHLHMKYPGIRATMWSLFGKTRFQVKVDLGFGDLIKPKRISLPLIEGGKKTLFESEVQISCYPKEFIFAEKLETVVYRGVNNSRMKDFHDLYVLVEVGKLEASKLVRIINDVFKHRETKVEFPIRFDKKALEEFQVSWNAHLRGLPPEHSMPDDFNQIILKINQWLEPLKEH